jgi:putative PIN family toxin of toxin-antitoxin system
LRVVIDTNVVLSGIFFGGAPALVIEAWGNGEFDPLVSPEIADEYVRAGRQLERKVSGLDVAPILALLIAKATVVFAPNLPEPVCTDSADDKFLACALAGKAPVVVSGDKQLLKVSGYGGVVVVRPRYFVDHHLKRDLS